MYFVIGQLTSEIVNMQRVAFVCLCGRKNNYVSRLARLKRQPTKAEVQRGTTLFDKFTQVTQSGIQADREFVRFLWDCENSSNPKTRKLA